MKKTLLLTALALSLTATTALGQTARPDFAPDGTVS